MIHDDEVSLWHPISEIPIKWVKFLDYGIFFVNSKNNQAFTAILKTKGRKTGKEHSVMLRAVMYMDKIYFSRHRPDGDWFKNAISNSDVKVEFDNLSYSGKAAIVLDKNLERKISELKYPGEKRAKESRVVLEVSLN